MNTKREPREDQDPKPGDDPLANIVYISVPDTLDRKIGNLQVDPEIMLPVEVAGGDADRWDPSELTWEQIIAAMLKILAHAPDHEHADYYRRFVLEARPELVEELTETGVFKAKNKDFDVAEEIFKALTGLLPGDARVLLNVALLYEQRSEAGESAGNEETARRYEQAALDTYHELLEADDVLPEAYLNAAHFYLKRRNYERARTLLKHYVDSGDDEEKIQEARRIIEEIDSQDLLDNLFKEAYDFIRMGKEREGIERIKKFLDSHPDVWNAWFLLGWAYRRLEMYEEARDAFLKAEEHGSDHPDTFNELAICYMELGQYEDSRKRLEEALGQEPTNTKIMSNLGILALKQGNVEEAEGFFHSVLDLEPEDPIAREYLERLQSS
ncbi:MAG: tetratricopeptide repeat protein [Spirochaetaceae bacterium]